ncbi:hypothetical protein P8452_28328 [Trifolium repens]|nr:hypothetical protein P8452_28328 [Trifolium repens]
MVELLDDLKPYIVKPNAAQAQPEHKLCCTERLVLIRQQRAEAAKKRDEEKAENSSEIFSKDLNKFKKEELRRVVVVLFGNLVPATAMIGPWEAKKKIRET